jgi:hypothetical protein
MTSITDKSMHKLLEKKDWQNPKSLQEFGYIFFGPLVFNFLNWLRIETNDDCILLFNSREGLFLQELYQLFGDKYAIAESTYFKTSRMISSLSSFNDANDIYESFKFHKYIGTFNSLMSDRFGITGILDNSIVDTNQHLPNLQPYINDILLNSKKTRDSYSKYINSTIKNHKNIYMVDSGYQGTTQYFLQKTFKLDIQGRYITYKGNLNLRETKGYLDFYQTKFKDNIIFFESVFTDNVGTYINISDGVFINEPNKINQSYFYKKQMIIHGIKHFITDMLNFNIDFTDVSTEYPDYVFNLLCTPNYVKNQKLFDSFYHDNSYARNYVKKISFLN